MSPQNEGSTARGPLSSVDTATKFESPDSLVQTPQPVGPSGERPTKRLPVVCTAEAYHGNDISPMKRSRLRISIASDSTMNLYGPLGLHSLILEAVSPFTLAAGSSCHKRAPDANEAF